MGLPTKRNIVFTLLANVCRVVLALVMVLSGFVKAVDPKGTMYKLQEYADAFSLDFLTGDWLLFIAIVLAAVEFLVGVFLLMGVYRKFVATVVLLIFVFFTPFTLYVAIADPVADCGCFGDAFEMSNEASFLKNLFLFALAVVTFLGRRRFLPNISSKNRWMVVLFSIFYISLVEGVSLSEIPVVDFRHYAVGNNLRELVQGEPGVYRLLHTYRKNGESHEFSQDSLPDDTWEHVSTRSELVAEGRKPVVGDFSILEWESDNDVADDILSDTGRVFVLVAEFVNEASVGRVDKINDLYDYCLENGLPFYAATASDEDEIELWRKRTGAECPIYWADNMLLRTMVRANPGVLLLRNGVIEGKWNVANMPEVHEIMSSGAGDDRRNGTEMRGLRFWALFFVVPLAFIVLLDLLTGRKKKEKPAEAEAAGTMENNTAIDE
ncbi:MAG: DoxX family membrane protein [Bacteroidaceae bacterium]|nr:DoxX family membrane protein [Bacteroidaceae bacterium]